MADQQLKNINQDQDSFISKRLIGRILDYWYLFVISLAVCLGLAWLKVYYATPMYKVSSQVLVEENKSGNAQAFSGGELNLSSYFSSRLNLQNEIGILQTTDLCREVVTNLQLNISYFHKGNVRAVELYKSSPFQVFYQPENGFVVPVSWEISFLNQLSNEFVVTAGNSHFKWHFNDTLHYNNGSYYFIKTGKPFDTGATYILSIQNPDAISAQMSANLLPELYLQRSSILRLTYNTNLPEKGVDVLLGIVKAYISRNLNIRNQMSDSTIKFINERIALVGNELGGIETTIQQFKQNNKLTDIASQSQVLVGRSNNYIEQLNTLDVQLQVLQTMLAYVEDEQNNRRPVPSLLNSDATFGGLVGQYNTLQVQRDKILLSLKEDNPLAANLDVQIAGLRSSIIKSLKSQQQALTISRSNLNSQNAEVSGLIRNVPEQERRFLDYNREQSVKQALYLFLLQKKEETAIAKASNVPNASIIENPEVNYTPYEPNKNQTLIMGLIVGLLLPSGFIALRLLLNNKIMSREDVTKLTPVTILSEVGHSETQDLLNLKESGRSSVAEQFRIFRTNMDFALANIQSPVILITSCLSGEGKSFIAANLAQIYSVSGKKVLLMELDLRKPKLSKMLGISNDTGFSNYIITNRPVQEFIRPVTSIDSMVDILPSGPVPPNPAELLLSGKMSQLMADLKKQYDIIIIDTAPIGAVTDAQILGKVSDISLYIIRQGYSIKNSVEIVNDIVLNAKLPSLYLILNDIKAGTSYRYGYGYGYGYGYSYGYAETEKKSSKKWWQRK